MFDKEKLLNQKYDKAGSTEYLVPPEGEFKMMVDGDVPVDRWLRSGKSSKTGEEFMAYEIPIVILDDRVRAEMGREKVTSRYRGFLDFDAAGDLDFGPGKNVKLNQLRDVVGQNVPGKPWGLADLAGKGPFLGKIGHDSSSGTTYAEVRSVTRI